MNANIEIDDFISLIKDIPVKNGFSKLDKKIDDKWLESYHRGKMDSYLHLFKTRSYKEGFLERILYQYNEAFAEYEIFFERCVGLAQDYYNITNDSKENIHKVLRLLNANVVLRFQEILCLLKNGFADGAIISWSSMFENVTTMIFIAEEYYNKNNKQIVDKFLDWGYIKAYYQAAEYNQNTLGYKKFTKKQIESKKKSHDKIITKYKLSDIVKKKTNSNGVVSTGFINYGWSDSNLEKIIESGNPHLKQYYTFACQEKHTTPKSHKLGLIHGIYDEKYKFLMNSSNIGMTEPAQVSCLNLWQSVSILVGSILDKVTEENKLKLPVDITILKEDINKIAKLFHSVEEEIHQEERSL